MNEWRQWPSPSAHASSFRRRQSSIDSLRQHLFFHSYHPFKFRSLCRAGAVAVHILLLSTCVHTVESESRLIRKTFSFCTHTHSKGLPLPSFLFSVLGFTPSTPAGELDTARCCCVCWQHSFSRFSSNQSSLPLAQWIDANWHLLPAQTHTHSNTSTLLSHFTLPCIPIQFGQLHFITAPSSSSSSFSHLFAHLLLLLLLASIASSATATTGTTNRHHQQAPAAPV